eukprot:jgi/Tetstr1/443847/TSEL_031801.t1
MDNTVRENKNRNVASLCNWLVSIGICDVIHLVFLPVGHTHERVDQIFSRISLALSRSSAYTIEAFLDLVAKAFSPTPEIAELSFSLDFSEWLRPHFQDHIQDISKPHKFEFTRDDAAASGGSLRTALWSNTPLSEPVQILKSAPTGTPEIRAGRPLLYAMCDKKKPDAVKVQRYLDDFKKVRSYITDLAVEWHFSPVERESWKNLLDDLDEMQTAPSAAFSGFWPQRKEEVDDFLREHGQTAPAEARHTMATNADLNNAEAARVEAEVRAEVLQDGSAFLGVHAGAKERLHDNTSPSDAKGSNLVVIDVSDVHEEDKCPETLGDWESRFVIGLVKSRETTEDTLTVAVYEPFHADAKGKPLMPRWLYAQTKGGKKPVHTSWEKCLTLPWKLVEAVPLSYAKAIHDASGSREVFNEDSTMDVGFGPGAFWLDEPSLAKQSDIADLPVGQMYLVVGLLIQGEHNVTPNLYELVDDIKHAGDKGPMAVTHTNAERLVMIETWRFRDLLRRASIKVMNAIHTAKGGGAIRLLTPDEPARNWGNYLSDHIIDWDVEDKVSDQQAAARLDAITNFRAKVDDLGPIGFPRKFQDLFKGAHRSSPLMVLLDMKSADCLTPLPVREHIAATNTN